MSSYLDVASSDGLSRSLSSPPTTGPQLQAYQQDLAVASNSYSLRTQFKPQQLRDYHYEIRAHAPDHIPILEGPLHGPAIQPNGDRHYGFVHATGKDPQAYEMARNHLSQDPQMRSVWLQLEDGATYRRDGLSGKELPHDEPTVTHLKTIKGLLKTSAAGYDSIHWYVRQGLLVNPCKDGLPSAISPATVLGHEGIHRFHFATDYNSTLVRLATPVGRSYNREELSTTRHEAAFAATIGEGQRHMYHGGLLRMKSITDRLPTLLPQLQNMVARTQMRRDTFPKHPITLPLNELLDIASQGAGGLAYAKQQVDKLDSNTFRGRMNRAKYRWKLRKMTKLHQPS